jgi:hypothetical protein
MSRAAGRRRQGGPQDDVSSSCGEEGEGQAGGGGTPKVYVYASHRLSCKQGAVAGQQAQQLKQQRRRRRQQQPSAQRALDQAPPAAASFTPNTAAALATMEQALYFMRSFNQEHGAQLRSRSAAGSPVARSPARRVAGSAGRLQRLAPALPCEWSLAPGVHEGL